MASEFERLTRSVLENSSPSGEFTASGWTERDEWEDHVRCLLSEVFLLGMAADQSHEQEKDLIRQQEEYCQGRSSGNNQKEVKDV